MSFSEPALMIEPNPPLRLGQMKPMVPAYQHVLNHATSMAPPNAAPKTASEASRE